MLDCLILFLLHYDWMECCLFFASMMTLNCIFLNESKIFWKVEMNKYIIFVNILFPQLEMTWLYLNKYMWKVSL